MAHKKLPTMHVTLEDHGTAGFVVDWQSEDHAIHDWTWYDRGQLPYAKELARNLVRAFRSLGRPAQRHHCEGQCGHYPVRAIRRRSGKGVK